MLKFTVIGRYGPYPQESGGTSCYLVQTEKTLIIADMGCCALSRLQSFIDLADIDAIVITHLHADHIADLLAARYYYALNKKFLSQNRKLKVYLPIYDCPELQIIRASNFELIDISTLKNTLIGDISLNFFEMKHPVPSYAVNFRHGEKSFIYSGDTALNDNIKLSLKGASAFLCDCGNVEGDARSPHIAVKDAAKLAKEKGVRFYMTHFSDLDTAKAVSIATAEGAEAIAVEEFKSYQI